jgi:phosphoglycerate dehydrogenase-like enzyme
VVTLPEWGWADLWPEGHDPAPVELRVWDPYGPVPDRADLVVLPYLDPGPCLPHLAEIDGLAVVQTLTAGFDDVLPYLPSGVTLCTAAGVHDASTAELAIGLVLASLRGIDEAVRDGQQGRWRHGPHPSLADRRVLLLGTGGIGSAIANRLSAFEVALTRVASRAREDTRGHVHGADELPALLPHHDVVILACPLTDRTRGLFDATALAAMPSGALLVNVARGAVVVTDALVAELERGRLRAALDVVDPEPLPADHPLWRLPGAIVTPHLGGHTTAFPVRARRLLRDQVERFGAGQPLRNVVAGPGR